MADKYSNGNKCAGLAISGDLTWQSQVEGFELASKFIKDVSSSLSLTPDDIIICPGNHDVGLVSKEQYFEIMGKYVLFDYQERNILSQAAKTWEIPSQLS